MYRMLCHVAKKRPTHRNCPVARERVKCTATPTLGSTDRKNLKKREADVEKNDMQTMSARLYTHICLRRLNACHIREKSSSDVCSYSNMDIFVKSSSLYSCFRRHTSDLKVLSSRACLSRCFYYTQIICRQSDPAHTLIVLDRGVSHNTTSQVQDAKSGFPHRLLASRLTQGGACRSVGRVQLYSRIYFY